MTVLLRDDGGTANGGADTSTTKTFTITVNTPVPATTTDTGGTGSAPPPNPVVPPVSLPPTVVVVAPAPLVTGSTTTDSGTGSSGSGSGTAAGSSSPTVTDTGSTSPEVTLSSTTANGGLVIFGGDDGTLGANGLYLAKTPSSQEVLVNQLGTFNLPQGIFRESDPSAKVKIEASLADGSPLPDWITFDPGSGRFSAIPPTGSGGAMDLKITASDQNGNVAATQFMLHITESKSEKPATTNPPTDDGASNDVPDGNGSHVSQAALHDYLVPLRTLAAHPVHGRPSLNEQLAASNQRVRMPALLQALQKVVSSKS